MIDAMHAVSHNAEMKTCTKILLLSLIQSYIFCTTEMKTSTIVEMLAVLV